MIVMMKHFLLRLRVLAFLLALSGGTWYASAQQPEYDVLIRGGRIVDGTGNPWYIADVAIRDGRIAAIGKLGNAPAKRTIDATGMVVAPGFIDLHTHSDIPLVADGKAEAKVRDGVTLDVISEGGSVAPRDGLPVQTTDGVREDWVTFTDYFARLMKQGISMNVISHVGAAQVRRVVMGYSDQPATPEQMDRMKKLIARSMEEGAWGMSTARDSGGPPPPGRDRRTRQSGEFVRRQLHLPHRQRRISTNERDRVRRARGGRGPDSGAHLPPEDSRAR